MPDSLLASRRARAVAEATTVRRQSPAAMVASAQIYAGSQGDVRSLVANTAQEAELWGFYDTLGEFSSFVSWMARACSRVRLVAAEQPRAGDEPIILEDGPAAALMADFYGGMANQSAFFEAIVPQLLVPGQGFLLPERFDPSTPLILADWSVQSTDTFQSRAGVNRVQVEPGIWRDLLPDALPARIWVAHPRFPYVARSPSLAGLPIMRRIDMLDRRIVAELLSRLVMNGILWIPQEGQLPTNPQYQDEPDPFFAEFIDIAGRNMSTIGSALQAVPMPVKFPGDLIEKIRHTKFSELLDEQLLKEREYEIGRLAKTLPLSQERQQGFGSANHWNGFLISEDDVKISISPLCEIIAGGVTTGYLRPLLAVAGQDLIGPNGGRLLAWLDYSELAVQPDKSKNVLDAYRLGEASGTALRREMGLDESDRPTEEEQRHQILLASSRLVGTFAQAFQMLTGEVPPPPVAPVQEEAPAAEDSGGPTPDDSAAGTAPPENAQPEPATIASVIGHVNGASNGRVRVR